MDFQISRLAFFIACLAGLIAFSVYSIRAVRRSGIACYLRGLLIIASRSFAAMSKLITGFIGLLAASADIPEDGDDIEDDYLTGVYNFRTRKFDNGTDPYGWYEEDL